MITSPPAKFFSSDLSSSDSHQNKNKQWNHISQNTNCCCRRTSPQSSNSSEAETMLTVRVKSAVFISLCTHSKHPYADCALFIIYWQCFCDSNFLFTPPYTNAHWAIVRTEINKKKDGERVSSDAGENFKSPKFPHSWVLSNLHRPVNPFTCTSWNHPPTTHKFTNLVWVLKTQLLYWHFGIAHRRSITPWECTI